MRRGAAWIPWPQPVWRGHVTAPCFSVPRALLPRDQRRSAFWGEEEKKQQAAISANASRGEWPWGGRERDGELQIAAGEVAEKFFPREFL